MLDLVKFGISGGAVVLYIHVQGFNQVAINQSNAVFHFVYQLHDAALQALGSVSECLEVKLIFISGLRNWVEVTVLLVLALWLCIQVCLELLVASIELLLEVSQSRCEVDAKH